MMRYTRHVTHFAASLLLPGSALMVTFIIRNITRESEKGMKRISHHRARSLDSPRIPPCYSTDLCSSEMTSRTQSNNWRCQTVEASSHKDIPATALTSHALLR